MTVPTRLRRWAVAGLGAATLTATVPLVLASGTGAASAQVAPSSSPCTSASPSVSGSPSATPTASTSPSSSGIGLPGPVTSIIATLSPSASPTASTSPSATPTASTSPCATVSPSASATATASASPSAQAPLGIDVSPATITPGVQSVVTVTGRPGAIIELQAYSRPNTTYGVVRRGTIGEDGRIVFRVTPGTNTRLFAQVTGAPESMSRSVVINVRTALSLTVVRNGSLDYTFQGRILPRRAGQLITLYRVDQGREIITKQIRTDGTGTYRIRRVFTGQGTFGFLTRTGQTLTNAAGVSNGGKARPTSIYAGPKR